MEYVTIVLLLTVPAVLGFKSGPPVGNAMYTNLCTDMIPTGHNNGVTKATDTANPPYTITTSSDKYTASGSLTVAIIAKGDVHFEGFFIQARRTENDVNVAIGHFAFPPPKTQLLMCHSVVNSSWGHSDDNDWEKLMAVWKAPAQDEGPIIFKATIVGEPDKDHFYTGVVSSPVTFMAGSAVTVKPPRPGKPGKHGGTGCTHGLSFVLSAAALIMAITL